MRPPEPPQALPRPRVKRGVVTRKGLVIDRSACGLEAMRTPANPKDTSEPPKVAR
jgi:hypothetical protein